MSLNPSAVELLIRPERDRRERERPRTAAHLSAHVTYSVALSRGFRRIRTVYFIY